MKRCWACVLALACLAISAAAQEPINQPTAVTTEEEAQPSAEALSLIPALRAQAAKVAHGESATLFTASTTPNLLSSSLAQGSGGGASSSGSNWELLWFPAYIWLPGMDGTVGARGRTTSVNVSPVDVFKQLEFGYMTALAYRRGRLGFALDVGYSKLGDDFTFSPPPPPLFSSADVNSPMFTLQAEGSVRVAEGEVGSWDMLGGFRYWYVALDVDFEPGLLPATSVAKNESWAEPTIGSRIRVNLSPDKKWYLGVKTDVGGFGAGSRLSWQTIGGVGREIHGLLFNNSTLFFGYRHVYVDREHNTFVFDVHMSGFIFGIGGRFGPN